MKVVAPIATAVHAARRARVAVVFASDWNSEGYDRPTLALPGAADALISAVAAANRRTIVVLNTGGPVLMPWLSKVAAVLEAWYPGEQDGAATLAVLTGQVDPSGRLPVTFPLTDVQSPGGDPSSWPGVKSDVSFRSGLDIGYRYYDARGLRPLFPFGYGLSYTTFRLGSTTVRRAGSADAVGVSVTNTGRRGGVEVVEAYLGYPATAGEPPRQLKAFASVEVGAGSTRHVQLHLPRSAFEGYVEGRWRTFSGTYTLSVGSSARDLPLRINLTSP